MVSMVDSAHDKTMWHLDHYIMMFSNEISNFSYYQQIFELLIIILNIIIMIQIWTLLQVILRIVAWLYLSLSFHKYLSKETVANIWNKFLTFKVKEIRKSVREHCTLTSNHSESLSFSSIRWPAISSLAGTGANKHSCSASL